MIWGLHRLVRTFGISFAGGIIYYFLHDLHRGFHLILVYIGYQILNLLYHVAIKNVLRYRKFTYTLAEDELIIIDGGIETTEKMIPYRKIQHISISEDYISRWFGMYTLFIQTAGSIFHIEYLSKEKVDLLQDKLSKIIKEENHDDVS